MEAFGRDIVACPQRVRMPVDWKEREMRTGERIAKGWLQIDDARRDVGATSVSGGV